MKYAIITSALALASTVVAQVPPSYQNNNDANNNDANNNNVEASPVGNDRPAGDSSAGSGRPQGYNYNNGNTQARPVGGNRPAQNGGNANVNPVGNSRPVNGGPSGNYPQQRPQQPNNGNVQASPIGGRPMNNRPDYMSSGLGRQQQGNWPNGYQQKGAANSPQGNTLSSPVGGAGNQASNYSGQCLNQQEAQQFVQRFGAVLEKKSSDLGDTETTANALASDDFILYSNSLLSVQGLPVGDGVAAKDKSTWVNGRASDLDNEGVETLDVTVSCDVIYWHWNIKQVGSGQYPVKGFNRFEMSRSGQDSSSLQAKRVDVEFDSISYGLNGQVQSCTLTDGNVIGDNSTDSS